ncbi:probable disease resistance protein At4g27220 isoform X2 [Mangifera indica]|uniref:probable disease resistance protein At4g27220 isoform X2 n=1 Tax=Mangifera indica TaxID=29780 RepID=UPI001CF9E74A|nr:probable disease resistance protein At4g27220 isoform X2 [Mangifera indica]
MVDCPCIASVVSPVLQVAEWLAAPIWRPFKYLYNYTTNFKNLETEVDKLKHTREEVEREIIAAERNVEVINQNVKKWQDSAQEMIDKAEQLIQEKEQFIREKANNPRCFKGLCSNFIIHYKQSRKAFKLKRDDIDPLLQQERELSPISYQTNPPEIWLKSSENYLAFESRDTTVTNVRGALNDENVHMIGVYGMGGLGKTMLAQEIGRKANEEGLFEDIVLVEVSESPNIQKIQTEIADNLDLKFENESGRAKKLYSRMEGQKILLILDNIWEPLEFEKIGIPCGADRGRNKLLFTTRKLDVLESMGSTNNFGMGILNEEEAWNLFEKMAGDIIQKHGLHSLQKDVCKECGGLPLVISAIAKALRNKSDPSDWKYALQELKGLSEVKYTRFLEKEYTKIALSYKYLSDELKKMFLICSLMENNTSISDLFKHVVCLNILGGVNLTMEGARKRLDKLVHDLKDACLLLDGFESGQFAMHDVIRDVAIVFAHEEYHVFTTRNDVERDWKDRAKLKKCTKISLPGKSTNISQLWPYDLDCPNDLVCPKDLACLDLDYFYMTDMWNSSFEMPKGFFTVMPNLRVLNLVRLQQLPLPSSIHQLTNLQTLCLDGSNIKYIAIIGKLKNLKVLSMRHSYIKEFSTEMDQLTSLRLLDLSDCYHLKVIAPNVILKLFNLEELYLKGCPIQWKIEVLEELKCLSKLAIVELDIQDDKVLPEALFSRELERYKILVGNWRYQYLPIGEHKCLRILKLIFNRTIYLEEFCGIKNVELLCLVKRSKDEDNEDKDERMWMMMRMMMSMRMRMDEDEGEGEGEGESTPIFNKKVIFSDLKVLVLKNIISRKIWDNQLPSSSFQNLKELILWRCTRIKFVFPCSITKDLKQLQYLEIKACIDLEEIVATEEITEAAASFVFPELTFLKLENLLKLATFYPGIHTLECPKLKRLEMKSCNKFKIFNSEPSSLCLDYKVHFGDLKVLELKNLHFEKICDSQLSTSSYQNLTHLTLFGCDKIKYVFPLSIAKNLQQLQYLELTSCEVLERIVAPEEGTEATINFFFPQVSTMKLQYLPEFTNLYPGIHTSEWPKLKELVVKDCPKFKMFTSELNSLCLDQKINHDLELFVLETQSMRIIWNRNYKALDISSDESAYTPLPVLQRFQSLERLQLDKCEYKEIKSVFDLPNLNVLGIVCCHKLVSPVPSSPSTARSLVQLKELCLSNCGMLAEILENKRDVTTIEIVFQKLTKLSLYQLKSRTCFCSGNHSLNFPSLKELIISDCPNIDTFFREISNVSELTLQSNEITPFFNQKVTKVKLQYLPEFIDFYPGIHTSKWP